MYTKIKKSLNFLLRSIIVVLTYGYLYFELFVNKKISHFNVIDQNISFFALGFVVFFMLINYGIEAYKWRYIIGKVEKVQFFQAFKAVFVGLAISFFTPNRIGDFFGRVFILKKADRMEGIFATLIGNLAQLLITLVLGSCALIYFLPGLNSEYLHFGNLSIVFLIIGIFIINALLIAVFLNVGFLPDHFSGFSNSLIRKFINQLQILQKYGRKDLIIILLISLLRYFVYSFQFYLLFTIFGIKLPLFIGFLLVFILFFLLAFIPTIAISELGIRGILSLFIIKTLAPLYFIIPHAEIKIVAASSILWFINIAFPSFLGTFFVNDLKFFRKND